MDDNRIDKIIENEQEWRRYVVKKIDKVESDLNSFKIKMIGMVAVFSAIVEAAKITFQ